MKLPRLISVLSSFFVVIAGLTFIPSMPASAAATCSGATCTETFSYTGSVQSFTPPSAGVQLTITLNGGGGGNAGGDAGGPGGTGYGGSRVTFTYVPSSTTPLNIYVGNKGGNGSGGAGGSTIGAAGTNPWSQYNGGRGGAAGPNCCSGGGGGGGAATVISTGNQSGVIAIAGGGGGGGGAHISANGYRGSADSGARAVSVTGANGSDHGGDGSGGGGGGGGLLGGAGGAAASDGWGTGGVGGSSGTSSFPAGSGGSKTNDANSQAGSVTISYPNSPFTTKQPSFSPLTPIKVGQVLVPAAGTFVANAGTLTVSNPRWQISSDGDSWTDISPLTNGNYTITQSDAGKYLRVAQNATDQNGTTTAVSSPSDQVTAVPVFTAENPSGTAANTTVNTDYAGYTFVATGFRIKYTVSSGALPAGLTLNQTTGALTGKPTQTGAFKYKVLATNDSGTDETIELSLTVNGAPVFTSDDSSLQSINRISNPFRVGSAFTEFTYRAAGYPTPTLELVSDTATLPACGVFPACSYSYETLGLPPGLTFNPATGVLSGLPSKAGAYAFAIKATNAAGSALDYVHMTIAAKAPAGFALSSDKNSVTIIQNSTVTATVTASGGSGNGLYSMSVDPASTSICSLASTSATTATMTVLAAGNCIINGVKAADGGFAAAKASVTIPINKAPQSADLIVNSDANPAIYGTSYTWVRGSGGNGTGAFTWSIAASSANFCSINTVSGNNMYLAITGVGGCVITATKAGDAFYLPQSRTVSVLIDKATQTGFYINNPGSINWNASTAPKYTLSTAGGQSTGAVVFSIASTSDSICSVSGNVVTAKSAGSCVINATKAADSNYKEISAAPVTWTINQIAQAALVVSAVNSSGAALPNGTTQVPYLAQPTAIATLNVSGGSGTGSFGYSITSGSTCVIAGAGSTAFVYTAATGNGLGWCYISVTKAADINFTEQTASFAFHIGAGTQTTLVATLDKPIQNYVATTISDPSTAAKAQISLTGGLGTGAVTYTTSTTAVCSVDNTGLVTSKTAGTCSISITKAADANYSAQTITTSAVFNKLTQDELVSEPAVSNKDFVWSPKSTIAISTTGGSGTGAISYAVDSSSASVCSVSGTGVITSLTAGTCSITVTKAADTNYTVATDKVTVVFNKVNAAAITLSASPTSITYTNAANKNTTWVTVAGGANSTGAFNFYVDPFTEEYCSITAIQANRVQVAGNLAGLCLITVVQSADVNYFEQRAQIGLVVNKMTQTISATSSNGTSVTFKDSPTPVTTINITGQAGTGVTKYTLDPANTSGCAVDASNGNVTVTTVGTCKVTVSRDGDDNVLASNSVVLNLTITKVNQAVVTLTPPTDFKLAAVGSPAATGTLGLGIANTGTGLFTKIVSATPNVCTITGGGDSAANPSTFTPTLTPNIVVTAIDDGTCNLTYSKLGDANYNAATNATASFVINKASQAEINASITVGSATMPFVASPKATATVTATGGSGTGAYSYSVDPGSSTICSVNASSGVVTNITAGVCNILVKRLTDTNFAESASKTVTITFTKIDQSAFTVSATKLSLKATTSALDTSTLSTSGGSGSGAVSFTVDAASSAICSITGTTVTGLAAGECNITAIKAADVNYNLATATIKITVTKGTQATLTGSWWLGSVTFGPAATTLNYLVTNGGTGSGSLIAEIDQASLAVCASAIVRDGYPNQIQVNIIGEGTCTVRVFKSGGLAWDNSNTVAQSFTVTKTTQASLTATASRSTIAYFDAPVATFTASTSGGSGTGALSVNINPASQAICADSTVAGGTPTIRTIGVGICYFTITKAASNGYQAATSNQVAVTITKGTQSPLVVTATPNVLTYAASPRATSALTITGGSGNGAQTVSVDSGSSAICSYDATTKIVTALRAGKCDITVTKAAGADGLFNAAVGKISITINKIAQAKLNLTAQAPYLLFSESPKATTTLTVTGGTGTGAITYSIDPGSSSVCTLDLQNQVATITANYFGYCVITATKAGDANYADATASVTVRIAQPGTSIIATVPAATVPFVAAPNSVSTVTVTGSKTDDLLTYSVDNASKTICSVAGNGPTATITSLAVGLCNVLVINVSKASDGTLIASSATVGLTITKGLQAGVTVTPAQTSVYFATPAATNVITVTGGLTTGVVSATVDPGSTSNCSITVSGNKITMTALKVGECVINVTKAGNSTVSDYTTILTIPILKTKQANFTATSSPSSLVYSANQLATATISTAGGSGTGEISYTVAEASTGICEINENKVTAITGGDCVITVTKAGGENYSDATVKLTIAIAKGTQAALTITAEKNNLTYDPATDVFTTVLADGGSGSGEISYEVSSQSLANCSLDGTTVKVIKPGNCVIVATKAADPYFNSATASTTIVIAKASQSSLIARTASGELLEPLWNAKNTTQIVITGGSGYGALQLTNLTSSICSASLVGQRVNITGLTPGECKFAVTKETDYAFLASDTLTHLVNVASANTDLTVQLSTLGDATAGKNAAIEISVLNNGQAKAAGATVKYTLPTGISVVSPLPSGCALVSSTEITCSTSRIIVPNANVSFTVLISLAGNLVGGEYTQNGKVEISSATPDDKLENNTLIGQAANFVVNKAPSEFSRTTLVNMQTGKAFTDQISAVGFPAVRYTIVEGDLPAGLTLNETTGEISGVPTGVGNYTFTVSAYNSAGSVSQVFSGSIAPAPFVTAPGVGFAPNTVPAGTKVTIGGVNLNLITSAIIGGKTAAILTKTATQIVIQVPNASQAGEVSISLVYAQGTLDAGSFTYTGVAKKTPVLVLNAGSLTAGAGEAPRTLSASATAEGIEGELEIPLTYISRTTAVCSVAANKLTFVTAGTCTLAVSSAAGASFNAATSANVSLTVTKSAQSLVIVQPKDTVPPTATTDSADGFDLEVTATSGLTPQFVSATPTICDVTDDGHVTGLALGKCVVKITQAGDARFAPIPATQMEFTITADPGTPAIDNGDPLRPTSLAGGALTKMGDVGFTWNKKLAALSVETYGIWIGKINAVSEFTIAGKTYKCSVNFGILKAMPSKTPAQLKAAMAKKVFKASAPFCNIKTEAAAFTALKKGFAGLQVKVTITRFRMYPTTYKPINAKTKKPITTQVRTVYLTLG